MEPTPRQVMAPLGFTRSDHVIPDEDRPGLLRAETQPTGVRHVFDVRSCLLTDACAPGVEEPGLEAAGFETVDLSQDAALQSVLAAIRAADFLSPEDGTRLRECLNGSHIPVAGGQKLRVEHVADDGMILRRGGPNFLDVNPDGMVGANGHGTARGVHGDQDVFGTPLEQMMKGGAPQLFRHQTVTERNDASNLFLLNLWIPLQQVTQPLVLMDRRSLDAPKHQLRYGLPVTSFLERDEESSVNDIWTFLPDPAQEWYFRSEMDHDQAYVFDTLGEPHGATSLPGEDVLEALYLALGRGIEALAAGDREAARKAADVVIPELPEVATAPVRVAADQMATLLAELGDGDAPGDWTARADRARDAVIRKSIEMRMVATLLPV